MTTDITELAQRVERIISDMKLKHGVKDTYAPVMKWDEFLELVEALEKAQQRIAELESRTVKLPAERFCPAEYAGSQLWSETEVWNKAITACADELRASGIKVEAE